MERKGKSSESTEECAYCWDRCHDWWFPDTVLWFKADVQPFWIHDFDLVDQSCAASAMALAGHIMFSPCLMYESVRVSLVAHFISSSHLHLLISLIFSFSLPYISFSLSLYGILSKWQQTPFLSYFLEIGINVKNLFLSLRWFRWVYTWEIVRICAAAGTFWMVSLSLCLWLTSSCPWREGPRS